VIEAQATTITNPSILALQAQISAFHRIPSAALFESAQSSHIGSKQQTTNRTNEQPKENKMNSISSKIELFTIALVAIAFAAAQVTAVVSIINV
jgi:hypothetical protein